MSDAREPGLDVGADAGAGVGVGAGVEAAREADVTASFVQLATALATGADVIELLSLLTADCVRLLDIDSAGLLLADGAGVLHVLAASSERTRDLELFQTQREQGPCRACYRSAAPVSVPDLREQPERWPAFAVAAAAAGFASVHAVPMRLRKHVLGALGLFGTSVGALNRRDLGLAQALADVASVAIVQNAPFSGAAGDSGDATGPPVVAVALQAALSARVVVEQAKGILAYTGRLPIDEAAATLRRYAREQALPLSQVAHDLVYQRLSVDAVMAGTGD